MSIIQVTGSSGRIAVDRTPFYGTRVPPEIKKLSKPLAKLDKQTFRKMLQLIVNSLEGKDVEFSQLKDLETSDSNEELLSIIYTGMIQLLKLAMRLPLVSLKPEMFKDDLVELQRPHIDTYALESRPRLPRLDSFKWRADVAISTSVLNRALEPTVLMEMTLSNGNIHKFEVPTSKFHELRYNVAFVLKEMEDIEQRNILKIQD
ncbi:COMM domain-containing protein 5-like isoform X2 [Mytilus edulis]|uniref:COMM domain-containing protein 5-like isoform X2 n=1 Tax=Mytilus edulis TaxID=6550 RepID=UPI0039EE8ECA